jgi:hypothetical protein
MITFLITALLFLLAPTGSLGIKLIYTFNGLEYWFWFLLILRSIIALIPLFVGIFTGAAVGSSLTNSKKGLINGAIAGGGFGIIGFFSVILFPVVLLAGAYYLVGHIDPSIQSLYELSSEQIIVMVVMIVVILYSKLSMSFSKESTK